MHQHHIDTLKAELISGAYDYMTADEAFAKVNERATAKRLAATRYGNVPGFPTGVPGYPNITKRPLFDAAWSK